MIVGYTKLYSHREKADISFKITNKKNRLFLRNATAQWVQQASRPQNVLGDTPLNPFV